MSCFNDIVTMDTGYTDAADSVRSDPFQLSLFGLCKHILAHTVQYYVHKIYMYGDTTEC